MKKFMFLLWMMPGLCFALPTPATVISKNQIRLIYAGIQLWNQKIPGLNLHVRQGADLYNPDVSGAIVAELLLLQFWAEGTQLTTPHDFLYLEVDPSNEELRQRICTGLSCGGAGHGGSCSPAC